MRLKARRSVTLLAIYAVALHVILLGLAPIGPAGAGGDPLSIICHGVAGSVDEAPLKSNLVPGHACEHCNLCSLVAPPPAPAAALAHDMGPARILHVLRPASTAPRNGRASNPKLARGPPQLT
jgi:hypothetical protein